MSVSAVFDASVFNLNLFWWQECETISDRLFKGFYGGHLEFLLSLKFVGIASPVDLHDTFGLSYVVLRTKF